MRVPLAVGCLLLGTCSILDPMSQAHAESLRAPRLNPGDSWTYENSNEARGTTRVTHDVLTLTRVDARELAIEVHPVGTPGPGREILSGPDWSRVRSVNGKLTVVNQPLSYPLTLGKQWALDFSEDNPNRFHTREQWHMVYRVAGWEEITLPAGTFRALKIEGDGTWTADLPSNTLVTRGRAPNGTDVLTRTTQGARVVSGRFLKTFWYVAEVHRWVRSEEDIYDSNGVRTARSVATLEAYSLADPSQAANDGPVADPPAPKKAPKHARARKPVAKPHPAAPGKAEPAALQETRLGDVRGPTAG
jgi:hypothetical protein